jgi:hypothetical protein
MPDSFKRRPSTLKLVPIFLETERAKAVAALETRIPRLLAYLQPPKEGLKRLVEVLHDRLQNVTMHTFRVGILSLGELHPAQLLKRAHRALFLLPRLLAFSQALIVTSPPTIALVLSRDTIGRQRSCA